MSQPAVVPDSPAPPIRSLGAILADLYFAPSAAFADIVRAPRVLLPLAVVVTLNLAFTLVWTSKMDVAEFMRAQIEASGREMSPEQMEQVIAMQSKVMKPAALGGALAGAPIMVALFGAVLMGVYRAFFQSDVTFKQSVAIVAWSFMTVSLVTTPLLFLVLSLKGDWSVDPQQAIQAGPVLLLDKGDTPAALYALAASLDLFTLWVLFLLAVGYGVATRRPVSQTIWGVGSLWFGWVVVRVIWAALAG